MKKVLIALLMVCCMASVANADLGSTEVPNWVGIPVVTTINAIKALPEMKQGIAFDIEDSKLNYLSTVELIEWKGITLEGGYAGAAENSKHKIVGVISYPIVKLKDFGVKVPVLDLVELSIGMYAGYGQVQLGEGQGEGGNEFSWGPSLTLINIKF